MSKFREGNHHKLNKEKHNFEIIFLEYLNKQTLLQKL